MVVKVNKTKLMSVKLPVELKDRMDACRTEYLRQNSKISINGAIVSFIEREVRKMEKELRVKNPKFDFGQEEMDI